MPPGVLTPNSCYQGITFNGTATVPAGRYFIHNGGLNIQTGSTVTGSGVTFVLWGNAGITVHSSTNVTFTAPATGGVPYQGLLFYQCGVSSCPGGADTQHADFGGCTSTTCDLTGAIYLPAADLAFTGHSSSTCTVLIAKTISVTGSSTLNASNCGADGITTPSSLTGAVALAE